MWTYGFFGYFSNVVCNANTLGMLLEECLGGSSVHIVNEECVFSGYLCSEVLGHVVTCAFISMLLGHVSLRATNPFVLGL